MRDWNDDEPEEERPPDKEGCTKKMQPQHHDVNQLHIVSQDPRDLQSVTDVGNN